MHANSLDHRILDRALATGVLLLIFFQHYERCLMHEEALFSLHCIFIDLVGLMTL
jgi:hypothetical protein